MILKCDSSMSLSVHIHFLIFTASVCVGVSFSRQKKTNLKYFTLREDPLAF